MGINKVGKVKPVKLFMVTFYSRYYKFESYKKKVYGTSKSDIRNRWHEIMLTDEYVIKRMDEIK